MAEEQVLARTLQKNLLNKIMRSTKARLVSFTLLSYQHNLILIEYERCH